MIAPALTVVMGQRWLVLYVAETDINGMRLDFGVLQVSLQISSIQDVGAHSGSIVVCGFAQELGMRNA